MPSPCISVCKSAKSLRSSVGSERSPPFDSGRMIKTAVGIIPTMLLGYVSDPYVFDHRVQLRRFGVRISGGRPEKWAC